MLTDLAKYNNSSKHTIHEKAEKSEMKENRIRNAHTHVHATG